MSVTYIVLDVRYFQHKNMSQESATAVY